ncbi:MAG TPA: hypothetical protein VEQ63_03840 [Bryobacteraceae bacterium]|nr:hypothetical protein [Bryobacteraceae bacterium]
MRSWLVALLLAVAVGTAPNVFAQDEGITPEWDVKENMAALRNDVGRLEPLLKRVNTASWNGAPVSYGKQLQSVQTSLQHLVAATQGLAEDPHRLTVALDAFFRMEKMELLLTSLSEGIRKYQSGTVADEMSELLVANSVHRDKLRRHIADLSAVREQELVVMNQEAQRCRASLAKQSTTVPKEKK